MSTRIKTRHATAPQGPTAADVRTASQPWDQAPDGSVTPHREAMFWRSTPRKRVACTLCYRGCELADGEAGWCKYRGNRGGAMQLTAHGVVSVLQRCQSGYSFDPFWFYKPGEPGLAVGTTHCTSRCSFCMSTTVAWSPETLPWIGGQPWRPATDGGHGWHRGVMHPRGVVEVAQRWGCKHICLTVSEATLSFEFTLDCAVLARRAGLGVRVLTNGFSPPAVVRRLAPVVDAVYLGIKGSADPAFYARWMRAEGAVPTVLAAATAWKRAGVHLCVSNLLGTPRMQDDDAHVAARDRLHRWLVDELGPDTFYDVLAMVRPGPLEDEEQRTPLLPASSGPDDYERYRRRHLEARDAAEAAGLRYVTMAHRPDLRCHGCGEPLLRMIEPRMCCRPCTLATHYCQFWGHEQHATDGACDHCGTAVPLVTLSAAELAEARRLVRERSRLAVSERTPVPAGVA